MIDPPPSVQINDHLPLKRVPTGLTHNTEPRPNPWPDNPPLPWIGPLVRDENTPTIARAMEDRLNRNTVVYPNSKKSFWPRRLLDHLFQHDDILCLVHELIQEGKLPLDNHRTAEEWAGQVCQGYRQILALLLLAGKENLLLDFITLQISDSHLPLDQNNHLVRSIQTSEKTRFLNTICVMYQWQLIAHFFKLPAAGEVYQVELCEDSLRPWYETKSANISREQTRIGAYGEVRQIQIHPWQHNFGQVLQSFSAMPNMFAIKTLKGANTKDLFFKEADMLAKFNKDGIQNVRLLAKIIERTSGGGVKYSLLFPWAEKDLAQFWEETQRDEADIRWIAEQCHCLANALSFIHNPCFLDPNEKQLFGRHGDIKPENVLWFKNNEGAKLAFSDMGLAEVRKDSSRSNIPGENIPRSPTYRPPECEMAGTKGHISRSFDIWTLGCVFLEFVVWILEGPKGITDFHSKLRTPYINSLVFIHIFFSMSRVPDSTTEFAFQVHENVTERFKELHEHKDCTQYLHHFLDLIEGEMLIVQSIDPEDDSKSIRRISARQLEVKMKGLHDRCQQDSGYYEDVCPRKSIITPLPPVRAALNKRILESAGLVDSMRRLGLYEGATRTTTSN